MNCTCIFTLNKSVSDKMFSLCPEATVKIPLVFIADLIGMSILFLKTFDVSASNYT